MADSDVEIKEGDGHPDPGVDPAFFVTSFHQNKFFHET